MPQRVPRFWLSVHPCPFLPRGNACCCLPDLTCLWKGIIPAPVSWCSGAGSISGAKGNRSPVFPPVELGFLPLEARAARLHGLSFGSVGSDFQVEFLDESKKGEKKY